GTLVAGVAAGIQGTDAAGVAPGAKIIAIQVYSRITDSGVCGGTGSCLRAYTSDLLRALDYVYGLRTTYAVAGVNFSRGSTAYASQASCDAANQLTKDAVDKLRAAGIASIAATGNDTYLDRITEPSCISSVISVAASRDLDSIDYRSNIA